MLCTCGILRWLNCAHAGGSDDLLISLGVQCESARKAAEEGKTQQQNLKEAAAKAYSVMDESLQEVIINSLIIRHNTRVYF
jgi:hypothetical protein